MATPAPDALLRLVDRFDQDRTVFLSGVYKEEQLRVEFLKPLFESLGWEVSNKAGLTEVFKPVILGPTGLTSEFIPTGVTRGNGERSSDSLSAC